MPIRPEMKDKYPKNWPEIRERVRKRSGNTCEWCGVANDDIGYRDEHGGWHKPHKSRHHLPVVKIVLTVAHLDHNPEHNNLDNLRHLCQRCHNEYDAPERAAGRKRRAMRDQEELFGEGI